MWIFGPLVRPRTSADTATLASALASAVTVSPSTSRSAGSETVSPTSVCRLSISMTSPTATFCWVPPLRTIAYTVDLTLCLLGVVQRPVRTSLRSAHTKEAHETCAEDLGYGARHERVKPGSPPGPAGPESPQQPPPQQPHWLLSAPPRTRPQPRVLASPPSRPGRRSGSRPARRPRRPSRAGSATASTATA